jgi:hypothetical protein
MKSENIFINISKSFSALYIIVVKIEKVNTHLFFPSFYFVYTLLAPRFHENLKKQSKNS